ncbi:hypothetical protein GCM10020000_85780 [Streptomyces olivoverticillatus]
MERLATAHRLAEVSQSLLPSDVGRAELFAVQAYRYHPDTVTRSALFQAVTASPHLAGSVKANGPISALSSSGNAKAVLAGTQQGEVQQWALTGTVPGLARRLGRLTGPVTAVAADDEGGTVAAIDHSTVRVWASAQPVAAPQITDGEQPTAVVVSPSGHTVVVTTTTGQFGDRPTMWVLNRATGKTTRLDLRLDSPASAVEFLNESQLMVFESAYGSWEQISLPTLARTAGSTVGFGQHNQASALSPSGRYFSYANGASTLPVWQARGAPDIDRPEQIAQIPTGPPAVALALSNGTQIAEAVGTSIYVSDTVFFSAGHRLRPSPSPERVSSPAALSPSSGRAPAPSYSRPPVTC